MADQLPAEYVRTHQEHLVETTLELIKIDSQNPPGNTRAIIEYLEEWLTSIDIDPERIATDPAKPNLMVTLPGEHDATLLYNGHLDTVPFDEAAWTYDPLGEQENERIYGRGATDMKGAVAALLWTARAFSETDTTPPMNLAFAFVSDEETGGEAGLNALLENDMVTADACVIGETTCRPGRHSVTIADRGSIWLTLDAAGESAHGSRPMLGVNAIDRLYDGIETLRTRFASRELELAAEIQPLIQESIDYYAPLMGEETARELFAHPTINLGTITGGQTINSVPDSARAEIDIRLSPGVHTPDVISAIRSCAADCEGVTITDLSWSIGTYETIDSPLVDATVEAATSVINEHIYRRSATGGGDAKKLRNEGIPTVEFGVGTDTAHAVDEYTTVDALVKNAQIYTRLPSILANRL